MYSENNENISLDAVKPKRHTGSSRSIHPYFGKVDPALSLTAIRNYSRGGDVVLDPFCGSGTVVHDALILGRDAIGWDSSPLAVLIASAKIIGITPSEISEINRFAEFFTSADDLFSQKTDLPDQFDTVLPEMPRVSSIHDWFTRNALIELSTIKTKLDSPATNLSPEARLLLKLSFSRIITSASRQQGESTYRRVDKPDHAGRVYRLFLDAIVSTVRFASAFNAELAKIGLVPSASRLSERGAHGYCISHGERTATILVEDSRSLANQRKEFQCNLVVTSPPYLMSWDYGLYHKFRFYWLGFDLDGYEETEIGRHLRRKNDDVERYTADMSDAFHKLHRETTSDAKVVMVNAPSVVYGKQVDTNMLLIEVAESQGWRLEWNGDTLDIPGPHHGMYGSLDGRGTEVPGAAGKKEHVLLFRK